MLITVALCSLSTNEREKWGAIGITIAWGRMVEITLSSCVIFHLSAFDFEHKVEENAPRLLREPMGKALDFSGRT